MTYSPDCLVVLTSQVLWVTGVCLHAWLLVLSLYIQLLILYLKIVEYCLDFGIVILMAECLHHSL